MTIAIRAGLEYYYAPCVVSGLCRRTENDHIQLAPLPRYSLGYKRCVFYGGRPDHNFTYIWLCTRTRLEPGFDVVACFDDGLTMLQPSFQFQAAVPSDWRQHFG